MCAAGCSRAATTRRSRCRTRRWRSCRLSSRSDASQDDSLLSLRSRAGARCTLRLVVGHPDGRKLIDRHHVRTVEMKCVMRRLAARAEDARTKHGCSQAAFVAHAAIQNAVFASDAQGESEPLARRIVVRPLILRVLSDVDELRIEI